ncbi:CoA transferase [Rhodospirillales bacterium]|jgi:crotonobetainyl-CoA:carnitine CoA-transferase CaiB-like acyl-CoA transferase|nr:CoA transferase [Rhodospirillales bacterium]
MSANPFGPLAGVKVIELAHIMAGPVCGLMLADLGADVIKVEKISGGDDSRRFLPPDIDGESAAYMMMNRNKRGIVLDLKTESGKKILRKMLKDADVVTENYRRDTMQKLGMGYEDLKKINPGLIYCTISGFGRTGPYADRGGFDLIAQGMSGLMSFTGEGPGRPPCKVGAPVTDITAGILAALGVLSAYIHKLKTGEGQAVDTSLFEAGIIQTYWQSAIALATSVAPGPMGSAHPLNGPYQAFETTNGWITIGAANQRNWERLLDAMEAPEIANDERFATNVDRMTRLQELEDVLNPIFKTRSQSDWLDRLEKAGVPAGPVMNVCEMHEDPHAQARDMIPTVEHAKLGPVKTLGLPIKLSETPGKVATGAPVFGQHTFEVLSEYGFSEDDISAFETEGAIALS